MPCVHMAVSAHLVIIPHIDLSQSLRRRVLQASSVSYKYQKAGRRKMVDLIEGIVLVVFEVECHLVAQLQFSAVSKQITEVRGEHWRGKHTPAMSCLGWRLNDRPRHSAAAHFTLGTSCSPSLTSLKACAGDSFQSKCCQL